jgi:hypothetical protein
MIRLLSQIEKAMRATSSTLSALKKYRSLIAQNLSPVLSSLISALVLWV